MFILVYLSVELKLESLLGLLDEEETNRLWNSISDISHSDLVVSVNSCSYLLNKEVSSLVLIVLLRSIHVLRLLLSTIRLAVILVLRLILFLWDYVSAGLKIVGIISEQVILFCVNERLNNDSSFLSFFLEHIDNDVHDFRDHRREALENLVNNTLAHLLEHVVYILE